MSTPFIGTIQLFAFNYPPKGWATCDGQLLGITTNQALFALIGTTYGGDGIRTFALPDLRGRVPISLSANYVWGERAGEQQHTLLSSEMPQHSHQLMADASTAGSSNSNIPDSTKVLGQSAGLTASNPSPFGVTIYRNSTTPNATLAPPTVGMAGSSVAHENRMPYLVMNFSIALVGIFPSRN